MNPFAIGVCIVVLVALCFVVDLVFKRTAGKPAPAAPNFKAALEPRNITIGEAVHYRQHPRSGRPTLRRARVIGFSRSRKGDFLLSLKDLFGNRFSVRESRIR